MGALWSFLKNAKKSAVEMKQNVSEIKETLRSIRQLLTGVVYLVQDVEEVSRELRITVSSEVQDAKEKVAANVELILTDEEEELLYHLQFYDRFVAKFEEYLKRLATSDIRLPTRNVLVKETVGSVMGHMAILRPQFQGKMQAALLASLAAVLNERVDKEQKKADDFRAKKESKHTSHNKELSRIFCVKEKFVQTVNDLLDIHLVQKTPTIEIRDMNQFLELKNRIKTGYPKCRKSDESKRRKEYLQKVKGVLAKTVQSAKKLNPNDDLSMIAKTFDIDLQTAADKIQATERSFREIQSELVTSLRTIRSRNEKTAEDNYLLEEQWNDITKEEQESGIDLIENLFTSSEIQDLLRIPIRNPEEGIRRLSEYLCPQRIEELVEFLSNNFDSVSSMLTGEDWEMENSMHSNKGRDDKEDCFLPSPKQNVFATSGTSRDITTGVEATEMKELSLQGKSESPEERCKEDGSEEIVNEKEFQGCHFEMNMDPTQTLSYSNSKQDDTSNDDFLLIEKDDTISDNEKAKRVIEKILSPDTLSKLIRLSIIDVPKSAMALQQFRNKSEIIHLTVRLFSPIIQDLTSSSPNITRFYTDDGRMQTLTLNTLYEVLKFLEHNYREDDCIKQAAKTAAKKQLLVPFCRYLKQVAVDSVLN